MMPIVDHWFLAPKPSCDNLDAVRRKLQLDCTQASSFSLKVEYCYNVELDSELNQEEHDCMAWLLSDHAYQPPSKETFFTSEIVKSHELQSTGTLHEIGPRLTFTTAFSTLAVSVAVAAGLTKVRRIEVSRRYFLTPELKSDGPELRVALLNLVLDRMTEMVYEKPIASFQTAEPAADQVFRVPVMEEGADCLRRLNARLGLGMDDFDIEFYTDLFRNKFRRDPTNVECFDLAQSNSEHSRHWFFKGAIVIDGELQPKSLFDLVMSTQETTNSNNTIAFHDNSSAIEGAEVPAFLPTDPRRPSPFELRTSARDICFTAETHNFPTGVAPFPGATTGTGGRIRDVQSTGRGAHVVMGTAGYSVGLLRLQTPGEPPVDWPLPGNLARSCDILLRASDGASDYGNKFGEPVLTGFLRSFGQVVDGERIEWLKPIMFSGGLGQLPAEGRAKVAPEPGMLLAKIGGPAYRIGVGGGAASSMQVHGDNKEELDFNAVQRGDAEMEQKMNRVIRACLELREGNPILSIHDQGAGGNANVLKELCEPAGAEIQASAFSLGDPSLSVLELWGAEYQESNALLLNADSRPLLEELARREDCPVDFVGRITGDQRIRLRTADGSCPVDLDLDLVLAKMPQKRFESERKAAPQEPGALPSDLPPSAALERVLRVPAVGSKRFLTVKVDRSVTGLVASQQCVGPLHTPVADVAVVALSYFSSEGAATAIGEQPIKMLLDPAAGARLAATEALTNLVFAPITCLADVKCSCNWMWPAKLPHEGAALYDACMALTDFLRALRVGIDGGKDSLSMAARVRDPRSEESTIVKSPRCLVVSAYARCPDVTKVLTPELRGGASLVLVRFAPAAAAELKHRMGASALLTSFGQLGSDCPDLDRPDLLRAGFDVTQRLLAAGKLLSGHDVSDGGLGTALVEMALASQVGLEVDLRLPGAASATELLFAEEPALLLETSAEAAAAFHEAGVFAAVIGQSLSAAKPTVRIAVNGEVVIKETAVSELMLSWEEVSHQLERKQCRDVCAAAERRALQDGRFPTMACDFSWSPRAVPEALPTGAPRMAVLREVGSNGDRELAAAFFRAGFEVWDLSMEDLRTGPGLRALEAVRGIAFAGGFSRADVLGSAKGWAASIQRSPRLLAAFSAFRGRPDTFSLGICNGCQLMARLGLLDVVKRDLASEPRVRLLPNESLRFESRFPVVRVEPGPSVLLRGMDGARLGVWVAHGEGRFDLDLPTKDPGCPVAAALRYVGPDGGDGDPMYPFNPNGSQEQLAGVCSLDGRHTALMPHPERGVLRWQWPWLPRETAAAWPGDEETPWMKLFYNAFEWCRAAAEE